MVAKNQQGKTPSSDMNKKFIQAVTVIGAPVMPGIYVVDGLVNGRQAQRTKKQRAAREAAENSPEATAAREAEKNQEALRDQIIEASFSNLDKLIEQFEEPSDPGPVRNGKKNGSELNAG